VLGEQTYADINNIFAKTAYTYAGVLSASFFTIAILAFVLAKRVETSEQVAQQKNREINDLVQLNDYIIKHLQSGIIVVDQNNHVRLANEAASTLLTSKVLIGHPLSDSSTESWQLFQRWLREPNEQFATLASGTTSPRVKLHFSQLDSFIDNTYIIFLDDLSSVDHQIQQGKLASLGHLTASIAHEIRNPLGAISHAGELLSESPSIEKEDKRLLDIIHNHSGRVNSIVESILQLSRQEESLIEPIALDKWFIEFDQGFKEQFGLAESPFIISLNPELNDINFDKNHLKQIIDNLCSNALKYGQHDNDNPVITITADKHEASKQVFISVADNGTGMDGKTAQQIFDPFFTTSTSGTGLGLYISNQLAELNHAKLSYTANKDGGSRFTLTFK
jgi:two-component system sensor histidine kinase PilS (NtrC family)